MFDPEPREILRALVLSCGISITHHPELLEGVLTVTCPDSAVEVQLLMDGLKENIADEIVSPVSVMLPRAQMIKEQSKRIGHALAASADTSKWIVESWDYIINGTPPSDGFANPKPEYTKLAQAALAEVQQRLTNPAAPLDPNFVYAAAQGTVPVISPQMNSQGGYYPQQGNPSTPYYPPASPSPMPMPNGNTSLRTDRPLSGMPLQQPLYNPMDQSMPPAYPQAPMPMGVPMNSVNDGEYGKWNWGACLLSFLWLINHGQIAWGAALLLSNFIPKIGPLIYIAGSIYCGLKGNEMAWQFRGFEGPLHFRDVQKAWAFYGAITWGILLVFTLFCVILKISLSR